MSQNCLKLGSLLICSLFLFGCVHYEWIKPGASQLDYNQAHYGCLQSSTATAPPVYQVYQPNNGVVPHEDIRTTCTTQGGVTNCDKRITQSPQAAPVARDINQGNRDQIYNACMQAQGWNFVPVDSDTGLLVR